MVLIQAVVFTDFILVSFSLSNLVILELRDNCIKFLPL